MRLQRGHLEVGEMVSSYVGNMKCTHTKKDFIRVLSSRGRSCTPDHRVKMDVSVTICFWSANTSSEFWIDACASVRKRAALRNELLCTHLCNLGELKKAADGTFETRDRNTIRCLLEDSQSWPESWPCVFQPLDCLIVRMLSTRFEFCFDGLDFKIIAERKMGGSVHRRIDPRGRR